MQKWGAKTGKMGKLVRDLIVSKLLLAVTEAQACCETYAKQAASAIHQLKGHRTFM